jgi:hypothetical protein
MIEKIGVMVIVALAVLGLVRLLKKHAKGGGCPYADVHQGQCGTCRCSKGERSDDG